MGPALIMPSLCTKPQENGATPPDTTLQAALAIVEKKVRNLEKRKGKLDAYRDTLQRGKSLNEDQQAAVAKYDEVIGTLEFARELSGQFTKLALDEAKDKKKMMKKELQLFARFTNRPGVTSHGSCSSDGTPTQENNNASSAGSPSWYSKPDIHQPVVPAELGWPHPSTTASSACPGPAASYHCTAASSCSSATTTSSSTAITASSSWQFSAGLPEYAAAKTSC